jgi:site-specific recombinase XerD/transcriptional regulator with XRE-family HTH domain
MLNKLSVSELAELSNFSKSYVSQVKHKRRPPSKKLLEVLQRLDQRGNGNQAEIEKAILLFLQSRQQGLSPGTIDGFYRKYLGKAIPVLGLTPKPKKISALLTSLACSLGGKHAYFRALRAFYNWLYSPRSGFDLKGKENPIVWVDAPKVPKLILPSLSREQIELLLARANNARDKAIIALFTESGLRLSELSNIRQRDIDWQARTVRVMGKGNKEGYGPFGPLSEQYLKAWLEEYKPKVNEPIWGLKPRGIQHMLESLAEETGLPCNPHTFRRTFACLLRKAGVDTMTIKDLGRWESLEMVQRYTRSVSFNDSLKFYRPPLS